MKKLLKFVVGVIVVGCIVKLIITIAKRNSKSSKSDNAPLGI